LRVLIIDNYDSFVYNLAQYVGELGGDPLVYRNDMISLGRAGRLKPDRIIISPGPGNPEDARYFGVCTSILLKMSPKIPTLGVCLGHQGIGSTFGAKIRRAANIKHGKTSQISHDGKGVMKGIANPFQATRYHSLVVDRTTLPAELRITANSQDDNEIMGLRHSEYPIEGVQFHPESIITYEGKKIVKNLLDDGVVH
jgi:anthranilate synthase component 2